MSEDYVYPLAKHYARCTGRMKAQLNDIEMELRYAIRGERIGHESLLPDIQRIYDKVKKYCDEQDKADNERPSVLKQSVAP